MSSQGLFIVLEGIDGSGTTTQVRRLHQRLVSEGFQARSTREPSDGPIGLLLRQMLSGEPHWTRWSTMALLFAADRSHHVESEIEPWLAQGAIVLSDRYDASSLAYQSATSSDEADALGWICELNRHVRRPDLTLVLDVDADVASARRAERGEPAQLYERMELQQKLAVFYRDLARWMPNDRIVRIDGQGTVEEVEARVYEVVVKLAARVRSEAT